MIPAMKNHQSGFTLMELMTTVVLAGIVLAMAVPSYSRFVASSRVSDQSGELVSALMFARSEAIRRNATITLCRAASDSATDCATANANWGNWIVRTGAGTVLRRGTFNDFGNTQVVSSTLSNESIAFGPDGLARTGGVLVSPDPDDPHFFMVCSTKYDNENIRRLELGAGSRVSTIRESGTCS
jgi:type IV fimbrial biogenesis protein FimT